jgi:hypothetical protein
MELPNFPIEPSPDSRGTLACHAVLHKAMHYKT